MPVCSVRVKLAITITWANPNKCLNSNLHQKPISCQVPISLINNYIIVKCLKAFEPFPITTSPQLMNLTNPKYHQGKYPHKTTKTTFTSMKLTVLEELK